MTQFNVTEMNAFAVFQHAHTAGRAIRTRHYRNGEELTPLIDEPNYDFNFQQTRKLPSIVKINKVKLQTML